MTTDKAETPIRRRLSVKEAVQTIKQPVLIAKCECGASIVIPIPGESEMKQWRDGAKVQIDCNKCKAAWWARKDLLVQGTPQAFTSALQHAAGTARVDHKLRGKVNGP